MRGSQCSEVKKTYPRLPIQLVGVAATPLKVTVLAPCVVPKFCPTIVTTVPTDQSLGSDS